MRYSRTRSAERTKTGVDLEAFHSVVADEMKGSKPVNFQYCPMMGYEAVSWVCQSWTRLCCHTLGTSFRGSFAVVVFHRAT